MRPVVTLLVYAVICTHGFAQKSLPDTIVGTVVNVQQQAVEFANLIFKQSGQDAHTDNLHLLFLGLVPLKSERVLLPRRVVAPPVLRRNSDTHQAAIVDVKL